MTDYTKTKIYKIESHLGDMMYVGSTAKQYLSQRFQAHKNGYQQWKKGKAKRIMSYEIFDEYGIDNCKIVLIEEYPCTSIDAKNEREGHYIRLLPCNNKVIIGRTRKEYRIDNKDQRKIYRLENKDKILEQTKQYRIDNKDQIKQKRIANKEKLLEKGKQYRIDNKEQIKQYRADNKEKQKQYRTDNNEKIANQRKQYLMLKKAEKISNTE
jgi:hypothetical protein